tara:strand:+ start:1220 stop:3013 length:1794 start_codon:yes stop_codon:yes gene_type:complete
MDLRIKLENLMKGDKLEPFIKHIRFPHFKNLTPKLKIEFKYPITALVGPNGSNKSSILRAIACCPHYENLQEYWFETDVDPIDESGGRPRYIYGYLDQTSKQLVEVLQTRVKRESRAENWEPSRPIIADDMAPMPKLRPGAKVPGRSSTRWSGVKKTVTLLDFRSEISAFDKILYHGDAVEKLRRKRSKDILRSRSKFLRRVIAENLTSLRPFNGQEEKVFSNKMLAKEETEIISDITGKKYSEIRLIEHSLFENRSYTAILKSQDLVYSEAFAGSGEFAVVMLVRKIISAEEKSLIILDEPEVSLHPGAQIKLMEFLSQETIKKHHQIVIGTHSKLIIERLPPEAIVLLQLDQATHKVVAQCDVKPTEAFFHLGQLTENKKRIFVEDVLACEIIKKALRILGAGPLDQFQITWYPGGASSIFSRCMTSLFQTGDDKSFFVLDGDQKPEDKIIPPFQIAEADHNKLLDQLEAFTGIKPSKLVFAQSGGGDKNTEIKKKQTERGFLEYILERTRFLPSSTPEDFIWENMKKDAKTAKCENLPIKERYVMLTRLEKGLMADEAVDAAAILETQVRRLASISSDNISILNLAETLKEFVE